VQLLSDCLGHFSESFQLQLKGSWTPLLLNIKGEVVGPQFTPGLKEVDFGIVSYGFRCGWLQQHTVEGSQQTQVALCVLNHQKAHS